MPTILKRVTRRLFGNLVMKIGSLAIAILIWYSLTSQGVADRTIANVTYELRNIPLQLEVIDRGVGYVSVIVRGPQNLISQMQPENLTLPISLPDDVSPGELSLRIRPSDVITAFPNQISIMQIYPDTLDIKLDEIITKDVKIQPFLKNAPMSGFEIGQSEAFPDAAKIKGPSTTLASIEKVLTEPIDLSGANVTFNQRVTLGPLGNFVQIIEPNRITVRVEIVEKIIERSFSDIPILLLGSDLGEGIHMSPTTATVIFSGPYNRLIDFQPEEIEITADCSGLEPGQHTIPIQLTKAPQGSKSSVLEPASVDVIVPGKEPVDKHDTEPARSKH
jgi:hypothetical protein